MQRVGEEAEVSDVNSEATRRRLLLLNDQLATLKESYRKGLYTDHQYHKLAGELLDEMEALKKQLEETRGRVKACKRQKKGGSRKSVEVKAKKRKK